MVLQVPPGELPAAADLAGAPAGRVRVRDGGTRAQAGATQETAQGQVVASVSGERFPGSTAQFLPV